MFLETHLIVIADSYHGRLTDDHAPTRAKRGQGFPGVGMANCASTFVYCSSLWSVNPNTGVGFRPGSVLLDKRGGVAYLRARENHLFLRIAVLFSWRRKETHKTLEGKHYADNLYVIIPQTSKAKGKTKHKNKYMGIISFCLL